MKHFISKCFLLGWLAIGAYPSAVDSALADRRTELFGDLKAGPYKVGFKSVLTHDASRPSVFSSAASGREMQINIWYPAGARSRERLRFEDYVHLLSSEVDFRPLTPDRKQAAVDRFFGSMLSEGATRKAISDLRSMASFAYKNARPARGNFPLIVFAHANPASQSIMSEYLASFGYVVAAVPSKGAASVNYRLNMANLEAMAEDIKFVEQEVRRIVSEAQEPIGYIGMSNGAMGVAGRYLSNRVAGAIVSLDGSIGDRSVIPALKRFKAWKENEPLTVPIIHLYTKENPYLDLSLLNSHRGDAYLVSVKGMRHADFLNYGMLERLVPRSSAVTNAEAPIGFEWVCRYTLNFLNAYLKQDPQSRRFLNNDPAENGAPPALLEVSKVSGRAGDK